MNFISINKLNNVNFKGFYISKDVNENPDSVKIANHIMLELSKQNPHSKEGLNYIQTLDNNGYDIFISKESKTDNTVQINILQKNKLKKIVLNKDSVTIFSDNYAGSYNKTENFLPENLYNHYTLIKKYNDSIKQTCIYIGSLLIALIAAILYSYINMKNLKHVPPQKTEFSIKSSSKQYLLNDIPKDSLNFTKIKKTK